MMTNDKIKLSKKGDKLYIPGHGWNSIEDLDGNWEGMRVQPCIYKHREETPRSRFGPSFELLWEHVVPNDDYLYLDGDYSDHGNTAVYFTLVDGVLIPIRTLREIMEADVSVFTASVYLVDQDLTVQDPPLGPTLLEDIKKESDMYKLSPLMVIPEDVNDEVVLIVKSDTHLAFIIADADYENYVLVPIEKVQWALKQYRGEYKPAQSKPVMQREPYVADDPYDIMDMLDGVYPEVSQEIVVNGRTFTFITNYDYWEREGIYYDEKWPDEGGLIMDNSNYISNKHIGVVHGSCADAYTQVNVDRYGAFYVPPVDVFESLVEKYGRHTQELESALDNYARGLRDVVESGFVHVSIEETITHPNDPTFTKTEWLDSCGGLEASNDYWKQWVVEMLTSYIKQGES
jgi:hypothetical protein